MVARFLVSLPVLNVGYVHSVLYPFHFGLGTKEIGPFVHTDYTGQFSDCLSIKILDLLQKQIQFWICNGLKL